uniref:Chemokine interleukin-8-like domain-containing protein n=1 Tax=Oreochromis aureus TaxID=47969 RepID=A0A668VFA7_OREAU
MCVIRVWFVLKMTVCNIEQLYCFLKTEIKTSGCSKVVCLNPITAPIIGYRMQRKNPPCVI